MQSVEVVPPPGVFYDDVSMDLNAEGFVVVSQPGRLIVVETPAPRPGRQGKTPRPLANFFTEAKIAQLKGRGFEITVR